MAASHWVVMGFLLVCPSALAGQNWRDSLKAQLTDALHLTKTGSNGSRITEPGLVYIVQRDGISAGPSSSALVPISTYKDGAVHQASGIAAALLNRADNRDLVRGERVFLTDVQVTDDKIFLSMVTTSTAPVVEKGTTVQVRYHGTVRLLLERPFLRNASAAAVLKMLTEIVTPDSEPGKAAATTATIEIGQTPDQVEAALGKPPKIVKLADKTMYVYPDMRIVFKDGKVVDVQ